MLFSTEVPMPFKNLKDAILAYPHWHLRIREQTEVDFSELSMSGDPIFKAFWNRLQADPEGTTYESISEGLSMIQHGNTIIYTSESQYRDYLRRYPMALNDVPIRQFGYREASSLGIIFPKNSPLKPVFDRAFTKLKEAGQIERIADAWMSHQQKSGSNQKVRWSPVLIGQIIIAIVIIGGSVAISLGVLGVELYWKRKPERSSVVRLRVRRRYMTE